MTVGNDVGAKRRFLVLLYSACVLLSLAPSVVGPPERNFTQGQPELQQAMDNMVAHDMFIKRDVRLPSADDKGNPPVLTDRTNQLLGEAKQMLIPAKDSKEKEWVEGFVHRLQQLASVLDHTTNHSSENGSNNSTVQEFAQSLNSLTVPAGHPIQHSSSDMITTAVLESGPKLHQSDQMTSKFLVTHPETKQVKPVTSYTGDHSVVTKPGLSPAEEVEEEDELVRELQSLHKMSAVDHTQQISEAPETSSRSIEISTETSFKNDEKNEQNEIINEKERIKESLAAEVEELKRLGETEDDIVNALHINLTKVNDFPKDQKELGKEKMKDFQYPGDGHESVKRVLNEEDERMLSKINPNYWNRPPLQAAELPRQIYMNNTFLGMHINLPPVSPRVLRRQFHYGMHRNAMVRNFPYYHVGLRDTINKLQGQKQQNYMLMDHGYVAPNNFQQVPPGISGPVGGNPYFIPQLNNRYPPDNPVLNPYLNINPKSIYMPYPLSQSVEPKSEVPGYQSIATTPESLPTEFSEEMKRQLRDGKVILLSDNVVRSNFTSESEENVTKESA